MNGLALQGGGCLGYGQSLILSQAEVLWGNASSAVFDIIGGTSVGSIIGAGLAIGVPAKEIQLFFTKEAPNIFKGSWWNTVSLVWGTKYSAAGLEKALQNMLGTSTLGDCKVPFIATSYDWATDRPVYFKSYEKSSETDDFIVVGFDSNILLWQVCRASAAAQTYFPAYKYNNLVLMDGGNTGDNAPDMLVFTEMLELSSLDNIKVLSIGAGNTKWNESPSTMLSPSILTAGLKTITIVFAAGEDAQVYKAGHILKGNHVRLVPDLGDGIAIDDTVECLSKIPSAIDKLWSDPKTRVGIELFKR